ncbi:alpha/beta hydrolase family protein [Bifidobacterium pongonis]|uniref:alpha/beta hydrolase family protein n=1 Tax=Bifidobacterium pongonis TaxID=2834432 RepID=UPI001F2115D5|nr:alpha/beta hydrolase [Bifidobacterium pongonis]
MMGLLIGISSLTTVPWNNNPTGQTIATLANDTAVTFASANGGTADLSEPGDYQVRERAVSITVDRDGNQVGKARNVAVDEASDSTWDVSGKGDQCTQSITVLIREPVGATGKRPGVVFMHGAGFGTAYNSFGDVAATLASAGLVTAVIDKPVWDTTDVNRDYPASARVYDDTINLLRGFDNVDNAKVGIYATSESTWISQYLLKSDPDVAFQVLLSPMVFSPRESLGFFVSQDFALAGANEGYQSIVRRVFSADTAMLGLDNFDLDLPESSAYAIPTFVAYGSKDVMTAQVEGVKRIFSKARESGNRDVTVRSYPVANHVLRLGDEAQTGTLLADEYVTDMTAWVEGTVQGLKQTSERVAGSSIFQSIAVPRELQPRRTGTVYGIVLHASVLLLLVATGIVWLIALVRWIRGRSRGVRHPLGFAHGLDNVLVVLTLTTFATLLLFVAGLSQVIMAVVHLAWGAAPTNSPGMIQWSWPVIKIVCVLVVLAWSRVFTRLIEAATRQGVLRWPLRGDPIRRMVRGEEPVIASTRFARVLFWLTAATMMYILFFFSFWGLFVY